MLSHELLITVNIATSSPACAEYCSHRYQLNKAIFCAEYCCHLLLLSTKSGQSYFLFFYELGSCILLVLSASEVAIQVRLGSTVSLADATGPS